MKPIHLLIIPSLLLTQACQEDKQTPAKAGPAEENATEEPKKEITGDQIKQLAQFIFQKPRGKAQVTSARIAMGQLILAIDSFYEDYQYLPCSDVHVSDATIKSADKNGSSLMAALLGLRTARDENPKSISFFTFQLAKDKKDGLHRDNNTADLFDPWGNPYHVVLNYDYDNQLRDPLHGDILFDCRAIAWSNGPDGKSGTPETNKDNVYSWNRE